jgi:hypothetical protein
MKYVSLLSIFCLLLLANTCKKVTTMESQLLHKVWLHSFEEDEGDILTYRPNSYEFPPSRGRTGFSLEEGGVIKEFNIAPTDGLEERIGHWKMINTKQILVTLQEKKHHEERYYLEILSLKDNVLKLRKLPFTKEESDSN